MTIEEKDVLIQLLDYIENSAPSIYVRDYINGEIGNHALADLPGQQAIHWAFEFIRRRALLMIEIHPATMVEFLIEAIEEPEPEPGPNLGTCCNCGGTEHVHSIVMIPRLSPEPGPGCWGCVVCDLPAAGAVGVLCDACLKESGKPQKACLGAPSQNRRIPVELLTEPFDHDMSKHAGEDVSSLIQ